MQLLFTEVKSESEMTCWRRVTVARSLAMGYANLAHERLAFDDWRYLPDVSCGGCFCVFAFSL